MEKKEAAPPPAGGAEQAADPAHLVPEPQKKDMRVEEELQLDVKSVSMAERRDDYGYIITDSESVSPPPRLPNAHPTEPTVSSQRGFSGSYDQPHNTIINPTICYLT